MNDKAKWVAVFVAARVALLGASAVFSAAALVTGEAAALIERWSAKILAFFF